jgi:drug/metabolite transporter (DMT)-like permease
MIDKRLTLKVLFLIILNDIGESVAQFFMKKGLILGGVGPIALSNLAENVLRSVSSPILWLGIVIYALNFFIWILVLYKIDISIAMPVGSTCYIFVPVMAVLFLHETVSPLRWLGVLCIVLGIHFVAQGKDPAGEGRADG